MSELQPIHDDNIETDDLHGELRDLRRQRARIDDEIQKLVARREAIKSMPPLERLRLMGERLYIYTELGKRQDIIAAITLRESSYRDPYVADPLVDYLDD